MSSVIGNAGSKRRRRTFIGAMALALVATMLVVPGAFSASDTSVADYVQCANGKPGTANPEDCNKGWINSILNANNSQYREDQVTPQRLIVDFDSASTHSFDFKFLVRKGDGHAYDSLATWDYTETGAERCDGLTGPTKTTCETATSGTADTLAIDPDPLVVNSPCNGGSLTSATSDHQLTGQEFQAFGAGINLTNMDYTGTSSDSEGLYEGVHIDFDLTGPGRVYFYFGGHLAAGLTPAEGSLRGWGDDCGASSIAGGPYHIKLLNIDGASAGNRDNQIMSNAVLPLIVSTPTTDPGVTVTWSAAINDSLTLSGGGGGTATFTLYPTLADCTAGTNAIGSSTNTVTAGAASATTINVASASGTYYWLVTWTGDATHAGGSTACGDETVTVGAPTSSTFPA